MSNMNREEFKFKRQWGPTPRYEKVLNYKRPEEHKKFIFIAGPCSIESKEQIEEIAKIAAGEGVTHLRGGVYRAGTYKGNKFGFIDEKLIEAYSEAAQKNGLENIIEVLDYSPSALDVIYKYSTCLQVGSRQMQNYNLLDILSRFSNGTVFLKKNQGSTVDEWLGAAEYLLNKNIVYPVLIERGSSTYHNDVRWTPTLHTIPSVKSISNIPVIFDASHSTGRSDLVEPMACAGVAAGADGVLIEFHPNPDCSLSDAEQALSPDEFKKTVQKINKIRKALE